jgi:hypothetical protein
LKKRKTLKGATQIAPFFFLAAVLCFWGGQHSGSEDAGKGDVESE